MTNQSLRVETGRTGTLVGPVTAVAAAWVATALTAALFGVFDVPADRPALPTLVAIAAPVGLFAVAVTLSARMRALVLGLDPVLLTQLQAWRILGGLFLAVYAFGHLPGLFAWPAGAGDMAVGIAAPFVAWRLAGNATFLNDLRFRLFHYAGLLDFVVAVGTGIAARNQIAGLVGDVTTAPMGQIPLVLIPVIAVPAFIILHIIVLMQVRAARH